jgi:hypothetical protein
MKVRVNRALSAGSYHVNFEVSDFTPQEVEKMQKFGVPAVQLRRAAAGGANTVMSVPLNEINRRIDATFNDEQEAVKYEEGVLRQVKAGVQRLRDSEDKFSSSNEVEI